MEFGAVRGATCDRARKPVADPDIAALTTTDVRIVATFGERREAEKPRFIAKREPQKAAADLILGPPSKTIA